MNVAYLLSDIFPYSKLVCSDAGPSVALEYGWTSIYLRDFFSGVYDVIVVDNRHHQDHELSILASFIKQRPASLILLRVNDPFIFHASDGWYRFCVEMLDHPFVHLLGPYQPTGLVSYWLSMSRNTCFIYAPFTYDSHLEFPIDHSQRESLIAVSGNQRRDLYPLRFQFQRSCKLPASKILLRLRRLNHPGYPEKIAVPRHLIIGTSYVKWLSQFVAAFVDSTIYRIELLKYREIAYAGCAPIGDLPWSLYDCNEASFINIKSIFDLLYVRPIISNPIRSQETAFAFRKFMRSCRDRGIWRSNVFDSISALV
jgi:hypothetical protein